MKIKRIPRKLKNFLKNLLDQEDKDTLKVIIPYLTIYGIMVNFSLFVIFGIPFTWYSWIGWAFAFKIIETKIIRWLRSIIHSR